MDNLKITAVVILAIVTIIIVVQNTASVETRLLFFTISMPRALLLLLTLGVGFLIGLLTALMLKRPKQPEAK